MFRPNQQGKDATEPVLETVGRVATPTNSLQLEERCTDMLQRLAQAWPSA